MTNAIPTCNVLGVALAALSLAGSASAQFKSAKLEKQVRETEKLLTDRNRETMHPGGALEIVGVEQGDNDMRSRTPALERSDRAAAQVDLDELRERRMAMYETGAAFHSAPSTISSAPNDALNEREFAPAQAPKELEKESTLISWPFLALLAVVAALGWRWLTQSGPRTPIAHVGEKPDAAHHTGHHADPAHAAAKHPATPTAKPRAA